MKSKVLLYEHFEHLVSHLSPNVSVIYYNEKWSFKKLNSTANQFARLLQNTGIKKGDAVGLYLNHGIDIPLSILAIHKLGAYYVPLSKENPAEYNKQIINDVECSYIISDEDILFKGVSYINIRHKLLYNKLDITNLSTKVSPNDIAYILYTSGSTSKPKGVIISHSNLTYYINWFVSFLMPKLKGLPAFTSSIRFAAAVTQLYAPLVTGRNMYIVENNISYNSEALFNWFSSHLNSGLYIVPTLWQEHLKYAETHNVRPPAFVILSGEKVSEKLRIDSFMRFKETQFWNLFGPTETVANICYEQLSADKEVLIGKVLEGSNAIVVNEELRETTSGELLVSGSGVCRGYVKRPEINNRSFELIDGIRFYRTGDLVCKEEDGRFRFLGRIDRQIKWNGVRIELQSIENTLLAIEGVQQAVVLLMEYDDYENELIAFIESIERLPKNTYISTLEKKLPKSYIPQDIVLLKSFPKLDNGKVNINLLKANFKATKNKTTNTLKSANSRLLRILRDILHITSITPNSNVFELGINSMALIRLLNRINITFQTNLNIGDIYANAQIASLVELINSKKYSNKNKIEYSFSEYKELALNQKAVWIVEHTRNTLNSYNIIASIKLYAIDLTINRILTAIQKLSDENNMLRSFFVEHNGQIKRKIIDNYSVEVIQYKLRHNSEIQKHITQHNTNLWSENNKPPIKYILFEFENHTFQLIVVVNHILFDGLSIGILSKKLVNKLDGISDLNSDSATYNAFVQNQVTQLTNSSYEQGIRFWKDKLQSTSLFLDLPYNYNRPTIQDYKGDVVIMNIDDKLKNKVKNYCNRNKISLFQFYLSAFSILLHKISNKDELLIAFPYSSRQAFEYESIIGYFTNVVLHKSRINGKLTLKESIQETKLSLVESMPYWNVPFEELFLKLGVKSDPSFNPLYQVMFAYHEQNPQGVSKSGIEYQTREIANGASKFDMFLEVQDLEQKVELRFSYATSLFKRNRIEQFTDYYISIIKTILKDEYKTFDSISLVNKKELKQIKQWNTTSKEYNTELNLFNLFEQAYKHYPNNTALDSPQKHYTYGELYDSVQRFASKLIFEGVNKKQAVGISMHTSDSMIIAMLALSRLGIPYVPLDPDYPEARIDYIIESSGISHIICANSLNGKKHNKKEVLFEVPDTLLAKISTYSAQENDLLYVMFTSGSTGKSKGVPVTNKGVSNFLLWLTNKYKITASDRFLHQTSINFDISVLELFSPLIVGATLVITKADEIKIWDKVIATLIEKKITLLQYVPSALWGLLASINSKFESELRIVFSGGEPLTEELRELFFKKIDCQLVNLYGPTEASIYITSDDCFSGNHPVHIGKPIYNSQVHILDKFLNPVPIGAIGEIYLSGIGVSDKYVNNVEETKKRFVRDNDSNVLMFRTGDLGKYLDDGNIDFLGRVDKQVKIRGFRVELPEIEHVLLQLKPIKEAIALLHENSATDKRIIIFYTIKTNNPIPTRQEIQNHLKQFLPSYMVPSEFIEMKSLMHLPNGKIDTKGLLSRVDVLRNNTELHDFTAVSTTEKQIKSIWEKALGHNNFSINDNFFDVGGHSLLIVEIKEIIEKILQKKIALTDMYKYTSIRSLAKLFMASDENRTIVNNIKSRISKRKQYRTKGRNK
jgi:fengycin family lipopeptide synthetase D